MKIKFTNGVELSPIIVTGAWIQAQGTRRDALTFVFHDFEDMLELDTLFAPKNCETIIITGDDGNENIYKGYTIRVKMEKTVVETIPATVDSEAVYEQRITVSMAQRTYAETQLAALTLFLEGEV